MAINDFIQHFAEQFDDISLETLTPQTEYKTLDEWSSLMALSIIAMIDEEYGVTINGGDIRNNNTIEDLYKIVEANQ